MLARWIAGDDLGEDEAGGLLDLLLDSNVPDARKGALLAALATKGETADELRGIAMAMRARAIPVHAPPGAVDTCGTGGDGSGSFNVSTATALVVAAAGVPVVKHGNRAVSGRCGSADVLEALGLPLSETAHHAEQRLADLGFAFLFAPAFHHATRAIGPIRKALGVRTVFNLLGPLTNPAAPRHQLIGAFSIEAGRRMAHALAGMPIERCFVVHGEPGWDEATPCGPFLRWEVTPGRVQELLIDPLFTYGVPRCEPEALGGGDADENAALMRQVFSGAHGALRDAVLLNAALVLELTGRAAGPKEAIELAGATIDGGRVAWFVERLGDA